MSRRETVETALFRLSYVAVFTFMVVPLLVVVSTSFTQSGVLSFPPQGVTLEWYGEFAGNPDWTTSFRNSVIVATGTTVVSMSIGVPAAFKLRGDSGSRWEQGLVLLTMLPLLVPVVVIGVTLLMFLSRFELQQTLVGMVLAHSLWSTPLVFFIMQSVFQRFDWEIQEAALDLGASQITSFVEVVLPTIKEGLVAAALIAFIVSLQEFIMALFISGGFRAVRTVPVFAWLTLRRSIDPMVSVASTILIVATLLAILVVAAVFRLNRLVRNL